jgi:hypothetical protein
MTNTGVLSSSSDSTVMMRSLRWYCRIAPHAPMTTPISVPNTEPMSSSRRLTPTRRPSSLEIAWPVMVVPKSPRTAPDAHRTYRIGIGRSRFSSAALASITACGGRGFRCSRLSSGLKEYDVRVNVRKEANTNSTT